MSTNQFEIKKWITTLLLLCIMSSLWAKSNEEPKPIQARMDKKAVLHAELKKFEGSWGNIEYCNIDPHITYHIKISSDNKIYGTTNYTIGGRVYDQKILGKYVNGKIFMKNCYPILDHGNEAPICPEYTDYSKTSYFVIKHNKLIEMANYSKTNEKKSFKSVTSYSKNINFKKQKLNDADCY